MFDKPGEREALERAADTALSENRPVVVEGFGLVVAPDTIMTEAMANNQPITETWKLRRLDGRSVHIYKWTE